MADQTAEDVRESTLSLYEVMDGAGIWIDYQGHRLQIRQPTTEEYDEALWLQTVKRRQVLANPEVAALKELPISEGERILFDALISAAEQQFEGMKGDNSSGADMLRDRLARRVANLRTLLEKRTLADEVAEERAVVVRDRWLTYRLLCDESGRALYPHGEKDGARAPVELLDLARDAVWRMIQVIENIPFSLAKRPA